MINKIPSQVQVHKLLKKINKTKQEQDQLILAIKKGSFDMIDVSFNHTFNLIKNKKNNTDQKYTNLQQLILNAIKIKVPLLIIKKYVAYFTKQIGNTKYLQKLKAIAQYAFKKTNTHGLLQQFVKQDLTDLNTKKVILTHQKRQGQIDSYVRNLNTFLQENPNDTQTWLQLSRIYTEKGLYLRAVHCMQQVVILHPQNDHYMVRLAQLYVSMGGKQNIQSAIKYFSHVITKYPKNMRALWGLYRTLNSLGQKAQPEYLQLKQLCSDSINKQYSKNNPKVKIHVAF